MKLGNFLREKIIIGTKKRLTVLVVISAPKLLIESVEKEIRDLESKAATGTTICSGDIKYLEYDFVSELWKTGRGGKKYVEFTLKNGDEEKKVNYFPNAKYGRYIKAVK